MVCVQGIEVRGMETDRIKVTTLLVSIAAVVIIEVVARSSASGDACNLLLILGVVRLLETIVVLLIVFMLEGGVSRAGLSISGIGLGLRRGFIWSAGFGIVVLFAAAVLFAFGIQPVALVHTPLPAGQGELILFFIVGGIISPVAEELFFRGIVYGFVRRWGVIAAVTLSTLAFVLAHPTGSGIPLPQITGGVLFAAAYEKEGNLLVPITIHILGNIAIFSLSLIP